MMDDVHGLVARVQAGDGAAFAELYARFAPEITHFLLGRLYSHRDVADDLTADVFMKVWQRIGSYQPGGAPFVAWVYRIARNHLIDYQRSRPGHAVTSLDDAREIPEPTTEAEMRRSLDQAELAAALAYLTDDQRQVLTLRYLEGRTTAETARCIGKSEDAVKKLQARGLMQLRGLIRRMRRMETTPCLIPPGAIAGGGGGAGAGRGERAGEGVA